MKRAYIKPELTKSPFTLQGATAATQNALNVISRNRGTKP